MRMTMPRKKEPEMSDAKYVQRYGVSDRANHWVVAILFVILSLTGLAFFHPAFFFLSNVLGGPVWSRILHQIGRASCRERVSSPV